MEEFLKSYGVWIFIGLLGLLMLTRFRRGHGGHGCCGSGGHDVPNPNEKEREEPPTQRLSSGCH